jgi:hypothetical protein
VSLKVYSLRPTSSTIYVKAYSRKDPLSAREPLETSRTFRLVAPPSRLASSARKNSARVPS